MNKDTSKQSKKKPSKPVKKDHAGALIIGAGVATALGAYFLYGSKDAKKNRKQVRGWMLKAKGEILEKVEMLKDANEDRYHTVVDGVLRKYDQMKSVDTTELKALRADLKKHWTAIQKDMLSKRSPAKKKASRK